MEKDSGKGAQTEEWASWAKARAWLKTGLIGEPNVQLKAPICMEGTKQPLN